VCVCGVCVCDPSPDTFSRIAEQRYQQRNMVPATTQPREPLMA
jgi:hypothetical protein